MECFRYSTNEAEFLTALQKTDAYEQNDGGNFVLDAGGYRIFIYANFESGSMTFTAMNGKAEQILHFVYPDNRQAGGGAG